MMSNYDFDTVYDRTGTGCVKVDGLQTLFGKADLLPLWVADMDFAIAPEIRQALQQRLDHPILGYNLQLPAYYASILNWVNERYNWTARQSWIVNTPGVVTALNVAILTLTAPGDGVTVQTPVYDPFFEAINCNGRHLLSNPLCLLNGRYEIDFDHLDQQLKQSKLFLLCNPHNPVGRVWTEDELLRMGRLCRQYGVTVVADEIHADLVYPGHKHIAFGSLEDFSDFTVACYSPSKSFNLAGLSTSAIVIPEERLRNKFNAYVQIMHLYLGNSFGITALQAAYTHGLPWLQALMAYLETNRNYLEQFFSSRMPEIGFIKPEGTYLAWLDFRKLGLTDDELMNTLIYKGGLALSPGLRYGIDGSGFIRINFGCPLSVLQQACSRIYDTFGKGR